MAQTSTPTQNSAEIRVVVQCPIKAAIGHWTMLGQLVESIAQPSVAAVPMPTVKPYAPL